MSLAEGLALVFDLDGVIVDSMPTHTEAWRIYLQRCGIDCDDIEPRMHGRRNDEIVRDFFGPGLAPSEVFAHGAAKEALFREMMSAELESHLVPGIRNVLERYSAVPIAVASNAEPANIDFVLDRMHLRRYFKVLVNGMQVERPKPYPDIYLKAAEELGLAPTNCIVFEDSPAGIQAARLAGTRVVGVETHTRLEAVDFSIKDFTDARIDAWLSAQHAQ